jgi:DNA-binding transcriptional MerR regulator
MLYLPQEKERFIMKNLKEKLTVSQVSQLSGVSVRTLHHYDQIGLLHPAEVTEAGYRLYGKAELERLQQILFFRELEFPLQDIGRILNSSSFDRNKALDQQIQCLIPIETAAVQE